MRALTDDLIEVVASPLLLAELEAVLKRPMFAGRIDDQSIRDFPGLVRRQVRLAADPAVRPEATRDRKDDYLVALARHEAVDAIVSGDRHLLEADFDEPAVWTPRLLADRLFAG